MIWAAPMAWLLAAAAILPLVAHLWSRRRPVTVPFPTLRFLRAASPVSRRLQQVKDWPLLALRVAAVLAIVAAAAGPTVVTAARLRGWQSRLHRVIVVDRALAAAAVSEIERLQADARSTRVLAAGDVRVLLDDAIAEAVLAGRSQRVEIVVVWDGTRAALSPADLAAVPAQAGLRLRAVDAPMRPTQRFASQDSIDLPVEIGAAAADGAAREAALAALRTMQVAVPPVRIHVRWPGAGEPVGVRTPSPPRADALASSVRRALSELAEDLRLRDAAERSVRDPRASDAAVPAAARVLARTADGTPLLHGWAAADGLVLALHASPASPLALWSIVGACEALSQPALWAASLPDQKWTAAAIAAAQRDAALPSGTALPAGLDTRAAWGVALALLLLEQWWRRPTSVLVRPDDDRADVSDAA